MTRVSVVINNPRDIADLALGIYPAGDGQFALKSKLNDRSFSGAPNSAEPPAVS